MFERFTERARLVVVLAQEEARQTLEHDYIGTEHILLGLLREEDGIAASVLNRQGITLERVREQIVRIVGSGEGPVSGQIPFTPRAKKLLELALKESMSMGHNHIGTEHLLLGLLRERDGVGQRVLSDFDIDAEEVRKEVVRVLSGPGASGESARAAPGPGGRVPPSRTKARDRPNPSDPGPPITVRLDDLLLGDLGNPRVDARLLSAILLRDGGVAAWLRSRGVDIADVERDFPGSGWD